MTYSVPLKAKLKLYCTDPEHEDFETIVQDVYLGTIPYMTPKGSFVVNGAERIIVSQLHRSPGVFFGQSRHANGTKLYSARVIPFKGSWIEFATDINGVMYAYIDRKKKLPVTTLLRAIGYESDKDILEIFDLADEIKVSKAGMKKVVGRRLAARVLKTWIEDFVDEDTGEVVSIERNEILLDRETLIEEHHIDLVVESGAKSIIIHKKVSPYRNIFPCQFSQFQSFCLLIKVIHSFSVQFVLIAYNSNIRTTKHNFPVKFCAPHRIIEKKFKFLKKPRSSHSSHLNEFKRM